MAALRVALFQPDIAANAGAIFRLAACLGVGVDVIEPCGFILSDRRVRRAGMDYVDLCAIERHVSWAAFGEKRRGCRPVLLTTRGGISPYDFRFAPDDVLILGRESTGVPDEIRAQVTHAIRIPMTAGARSLNVATAAALALGEALRQTAQLPEAAKTPIIGAAPSRIA